MKLDLDARRAEAAGEPHEVVLGGVTYELPAEFPLLAGEHLANGSVSSAVAVLFGQDNVTAVTGLLTADDMNAIVDQLYDFEGEAKPVRPAPVANGNRATRRAASRS
jgi:hypothetical protein